MKYLNSYLIILVLTLKSCRDKSEAELFLIPDNYEGVIIVLFSQDNGQGKEYINNRRLYDIPISGILLTKFPKTIHGRLDQKYYYKDSLGNKKTELKDYLLGEVNEKDSYVMNSVYGSFTNEIDSTHQSKYPIQYKRFTIGKVKDKDSLQKLSESFMQKFIYSQ